MDAGPKAMTFLLFFVLFVSSSFFSFEVLIYLIGARTGRPGVTPS